MSNLLYSDDITMVKTNTGSPDLSQTSPLCGVSSLHTRVQYRPSVPASPHRMLLSLLPMRRHVYHCVCYIIVTISQIAVTPQ